MKIENEQHRFRSARCTTLKQLCARNCNKVLLGTTPTGITWRIFVHCVTSQYYYQRNSLTHQVNRSLTNFITVNLRFGMISTDRTVKLFKGPIYVVLGKLSPPCYRYTLKCHVLTIITATINNVTRTQLHYVTRVSFNRRQMTL